MAKILLVEDDPKMVRMIEEALSSQNHVVDKARGGYEAIQILGQEVYHLVITDLMMSKGTGFDLLHWLKEGGLRLPIVICSAYARPDPLRSYLGDHHRYTIVLKPFLTATLLDAVAELLKPAVRQAGS